MGQYEYEKEGIIVDIYARFAIAVGFSLNTLVLIKTDSLSLKLKNGSIDSGSNGDVSSSKTDSDDDSEFNMSKIFRVGDHINFDAMAVPVYGHSTNGFTNEIGWVAAVGSVRISDNVARTRIFSDRGNVVEINQTKAIVSLTNGRKVLLDTLATYPEKVRDVSKRYTLGEMISIDAVEQQEEHEGCFYRAISVEPLSPNPLNSPSPPVAQSTLVSPSTSSPLLQPQPPLLPAPMEESPPPSPYSDVILPRCSRRSPSPGPSRRSPNHHRRSRHRSRSPRQRSPSRRAGGCVTPWQKNFDQELYDSLPMRLTGYGRITYKGSKCSMLKDLDSRRVIFFFNDVVKASSRLRRDQRLSVGRIVFFEADKSKLRLNLHSYFDGKLVLVLDREEENRLEEKWRRDGYRGEERRSGSSTSTSTLSSGGCENRIQSVVIKPVVNKRPDSPHRQDKDRRNADKGNERSTPEAADEGESFQIDPNPQDMEIVEKVKFDPKPADYGQMGKSGSIDNKDLKVEIQVQRGSRVVRDVSEISDQNELDEFMHNEEDFAQQFEFVGDDSQ